MSDFSVSHCINSSTTCLEFGFKSNDGSTLSKWGDESLVSMVVSPNPVKDHLKIELELPASGLVRMEVFNTRGQLVKVFEEEEASKGHYQKSWDLDSTISSGIYIIRAYTAFGDLNRKFIVLSNR